MNNLNKRALEGLLQLFLALAALLFLPAWTLNYGQAWAFLATFFTATLAITLYLMRKDPALLERRMNVGPAAERLPSQKRIQSIASVAFVALFPLSALDHRFGWLPLLLRFPLLVPLAGDLLVALGMYVVFLAFRENSFTSATIEVDPAQRVISTGPYALVRHPMYSGAFLLLIGTPPALGSLWGLLAVFPLLGAIVWRLIEEERFLILNLPGYGDYRNRVRSRLAPYVW